MSNTSLDLAAGEMLKLFAQQGEVEQLLLPRLPEDLFVSHFLPLFKGDIKDAELENDLRSKWYILARHPQGEINITDNSGTVLFTTPSISYTKMFDPTKSDVGGSFKDLVTMANQLGSSNPIRARQYLENNLVKKFDGMRQRGHVLNNEEQRWLEIFKRYENINAVNTTAGNSVGAKSKTHNLTDDDLVDDDD